VDASTVALSETQVELQQGQVKLQKAVQNNAHQITTRLAAIEKNHDDLIAGMEAVQNDAQKVADGMTSVADEQAKLYAGMTAVTNEQSRLSQTIQSNSQQLNDTSAAVEQNRQEWQTMMGSLQEDIQQVASNMNTLSSDLLKLQDVLQGNIRELVSMIDTSGQLEFQEATRTGLVALNASISSMKENQDRLQSQISDVQSSTESLGREIPAVIEQIKDEISRISTNQNEDYVESETFDSTDAEDIE
jgi:chromosome segregation ATPase